MKISRFYLLIPAVFSLFMAGCASDEPKWGTEKIEVEEMPFAMEPEKVNGRLDVYSSMARAVKYNVDVTSQNMRKKLGNPSKLTARELLNSVNGAVSGEENPLYNSIRLLDFSVLFAVANLEESDAAKNETIYAKASQYLALAAIRSHQNALFSVKKIAEIDRLLKKQQKNLADLNAKLEKKGSLSEEEKEYKKGLDVAVYELVNFKKQLQQNVDDYEKLVKFDGKKLELEGRRFYELEDFDRNYVLDVFQKSAAGNREEFRLDDVPVTFESVRANIFKAYPQVERLQINGYEAKDPIYINGLVERAKNTAENLVSAALGYARTDSQRVQEKEFVRRKVLDELGIAIFVQNEIAYNMVKSASGDYEVVAEKVKSLKQEIREQERNYNLTPDEKLEVLNLKLKLMEAESKESQVLAERAVALRTLYFYAGFSPFNQKLMKKDIRQIVIALKAAFNQDLVQMLANSPKTEKKQPKPDTEWSKNENWLEDVVENEKVVLPPKKAISRPAALGAVTGPAVLYGADADGRKIMQLGAFTECDNAEKEWKNLQLAYPELAKLQGQVETVSINGREVHRLIVRSEKGGMAGICNKLRQAGRGCLLR